MDSSFVSFKDMHSPSREELHVKRKVIVVAQTLICAVKMTTWDEPTGFAVKHSDTHMVPHQQLARKQLCPPVW